MSTTPRLSICIPTFNRASLLRGSVVAILNDIRGENVELVVSDNASTDETANVMQALAGNPQLRYYRNQSNIGASRNIGLLLQELAAGEFLWVLGDDDLIIEGTTKRILRIIEANPKISYIFANYVHAPIASRVQHDGILRSSDFGSDLVPLCFDLGCRLLPAWEESLAFTNIEAAQSFIGCHIARAELWRSEQFRGSVGNEFRTFEETFPHLAVLVPQIVSKPIYYCGSPLSIAFCGAQDWFDEHWGRILCTHALDFCERLGELGVKQSILDHYRDLIFSSQNKPFSWIMKCDRTLAWKLQYIAKLWIRYGKYATFRTAMLGKLKGRIRPRTRLRRVVGLLSFKGHN
jgi:glycosyltransferase involved in cell wall biosynthesis